MKIYRNRWYVLDETVIGLVVYNMPPDIYEEIKCGQVLIGEAIRNSLYPAKIDTWTLRAWAHKDIKRNLRVMNFTINQAAVWYSKRGNKRDKIAPGLTGLVSGAWLEDVGSQTLVPSQNIRPMLREAIHYLNQGYQLPEEYIDKLI